MGKQINDSTTDGFQERKKSYIGMGSNHAASKKSNLASQCSDGDTPTPNEPHHKRNPIILLPAQTHEINHNESREEENEYLYLTYDSKSN